MMLDYKQEIFLLIVMILIMVFHSCQRMQNWK